MKLQTQCPLCFSEKFFTLRTYDITSLGKEWLGFGINPFIDLTKEIDQLKHCLCNNCGLEFYSPLIVGDSKFYEHLSKNNSWYYEADKWEFNQAIQILNEDKNIKNLLEVGCGRGFFLDKVSSSYETTGIELNQDAIHFCQEKNLNVLDANLNVMNISFNAIVLFEVLEHLANPKEILDEVYRLLDHNGILIIAVPNPESFLKEFDHVLLDMPPHHVTRWGKNTFRYISQQYNLEIISIHDEPLRYIHYQWYISMIEDKGKYEAKLLTFKQKIKRKLQNILGDILFGNIRNTLVAQCYEYHRNNILGQTHLVAFRKIIE
jgi:SAM-dependent methyltransferase